MHAETLLARLDGVRQRGPQRWVAKCPAHKDRTPSLSIREEPDGRILLNDFGGCSVEAILDAVGLRVGDLFPAPLGHGPFPRVALERSHVHAAADALTVIAREARLVVMAAEDLAQGFELTPSDRSRLLLAAATIERAAHLT